MSITDTLRDISQESNLNSAEKTSLRRIAKEVDTIVAQRDALKEAMKEVKYHEEDRYHDGIGYDKKVHDVAKAVLAQCKEKP